MVAEVCGVSEAQFLAVCRALCDNSGRDRTSAFRYAVGWTQHTVGVQVIRTAAIVQLLLGNIGRPGGGILALRGHATIQGSTYVPTLYNLLPGYLPLPTAGCRAWVRRSNPGSSRARATPGSRRRPADVAEQQLDDGGGADVLHAHRVLRPPDGVAERRCALATRVGAQGPAHREELRLGHAAHLFDHRRRVAREVPVQHLEHTSWVLERRVDGTRASCRPVATPRATSPARSSAPGAGLIQPCGPDR